MPSDDSFRTSCVLKTAMVMLKAYIIFLLGEDSGKADEYPAWEAFVTALFFSSFLIMVVMTLAFSLPKHWRELQLLQGGPVRRVVYAGECYLQ